MLPNDAMSKLIELDKILRICNTEEGRNILEELKKLSFVDKLQSESSESQETGPLTFLANMAIDASEKSFRLECELDETRQAVKEIVAMLENQIYNKGDSSPSDNTVLSDINTMKSLHPFLY